MDARVLRHRPPHRRPFKEIGEWNSNFPPKKLPVTVEERDRGVGECLRVSARDGLALRRVARPRAVGVAHPGGVP